MQQKKYEHTIFEDSVHGHILIPKIYCKKIIDNRIFQRLRRVEQTSMRPIFPSAHHDRFIHSLGVYYVGERLFSNIQENTEKHSSTIYSFIKGENDTFAPTPFIQKEDNDGYWSALRKTYHIACLLHDCGHAPFSHTLEKYYYNEYLAKNGNKLTIPLNADLIKEYAECVNNKKELGKNEKQKIIEDFKRDLAQCNPKPHELVSSWLALHKQGFRDIVLNEIQADPLLIARMIIGCKFRDASNPKEDSVDKSEQVLNCFISILNGHEIDADRLDYAARDNWATGLNTVKINLNRVLSSIYIADKNEKESQIQPRYVICFKRKSVSELQNLLDIKNFTSFWIFNHHKIKYNEEVLVKAVKKLALLLNNENSIEEYINIKKDISQSQEDKQILIDALENNAMYHLFDYKNLIEPKEFVVKLDNKIYYDTLFLMSDDDIVHLLKKYFCVNRSNNIAIPYLKTFFENAPYANEWLSREQYLVPLWKSYSEYDVRYLKPFLLELGAIKEFKSGIENFSKPQQKNIKYYKNILNDNEKLKEFLSKIRAYKKQDAVSIILEKCSDNTNSNNLFDNIKSLLEEAETYYSEKETYEKILGDVAMEIIQEIKQDGFSIKPETETPKIIHIEKLDIKEIKTNSIFVEINGEIFCYTELNLPQKNQEKKYDFFYIFMPKIFDKEGKKELLKKNKEYSTKFKEKFQKIQYKIPQE